MKHEDFEVELEAHPTTPSARFLAAKAAIEAKEQDRIRKGYAVMASFMPMSEALEEQTALARAAKWAKVVTLLGALILLNLMVLDARG